jgi:hypothetical protein
MYDERSLILKQSTINDNVRHYLSNHPFFQTPIYDLQNQNTFIKDQPKSEYDLAILQFLKDQQYDHSNYCIEYWFQKYDNTHPLGLFPHCDYNDTYRDTLGEIPKDWPHRENPKLIVSPMTIVVYLEISDDIQGGELNISHRTWYEEEFPILAWNHIKEYPFDQILPVQGSVIYFKGSDHYHWVSPVTKGYRKSLIINFWSPELEMFRNPCFE